MFAYTSFKYHCFVYRCQWAYLNLLTTIIAIKTGNFLHYLCKKKPIGLPSMVQTVTKQMLCSRFIALHATIFVT